jgi:hypothetical protein
MDISKITQSVQKALNGKMEEAVPCNVIISTLADGGDYNYHIKLALSLTVRKWVCPVPSAEALMQKSLYVLPRAKIT